MIDMYAEVPNVAFQIMVKFFIMFCSWILVFADVKYKYIQLYKYEYKHTGPAFDFDLVPTLN